MKKNFTLAIHGGAGSVPKKYLEENRTSYEALLNSTLKHGKSLLEAGKRASEVVVEIVSMLEDSDKFNAGKGSVLNHAGEVTMDASFADGKTMEFGSVINVKFVKNPIKLAHKLFEFKEHNMISGDGALEFARENNLELETMEYFVTEYRKKQLEKAQRAGSFCLDHFDENTHPPEKDDSKYGTVGAVAMDIYGDLAAATSTGGITNKMYGRVGDSPIMGAGIFASNASVAVSSTGRGEVFSQHLVAYDLHARMIYKKDSIKTASESIIANSLPKGSGGIIAVDNKGNYSMPFNTDMMFRGAVTQDHLMIGIEPD